MSVQVSCSVDVSAGGDLAMMCGQNCVSGCNGPNPCPFCSCPKRHLSSVGMVHPARTSARIKLLSHLVVGGQCPACEMWIVDTITDKKTQVLVGVRDGPVPPVPAHKSGPGVTHLSLHEGTTQTHTRTHIRTHTHSHMRTCMHTQKHTDTHAHTFTQALCSGKP